MNWSIENQLVMLPLILGWFAVWWLLPRERGRSRLLGALFAVGALLGLQSVLLPPAGDLIRDSLFYLFAATAVLSGGLMITDRNPVYAALWFAVTTLSVCGLFLLNSAPFLAAATIIVYAGAIIVTFLFVIMLAQQTANSNNYDSNAVQPFAASVTSFVLLGALLFSLQEWGGINGKPNGDIQEGQFVHLSADHSANLFSQPPTSNKSEIGSMRVLGRSLFSDYLYAVELAGTVLLIATIGAIALAPRRSQGTL